MTHHRNIQVDRLELDPGTPYCEMCEQNPEFWTKDGPKKSLPRAASASGLCENCQSQLDAEVEWMQQRPAANERTIKRAARAIAIVMAAMDWTWSKDIAGKKTYVPTAAQVEEHIRHLMKEMYRPRDTEYSSGTIESGRVLIKEDRGGSIPEDTIYLSLGSVY